MEEVKLSDYHNIMLVLVPIKGCNLLSLLDHLLYAVRKIVLPLTLYFCFTKMFDWLFFFCYFMRLREDVSYFWNLLKFRSIFKSINCKTCLALLHMVILFPDYFTCELWLTSVVWQDKTRSWIAIWEIFNSIIRGVFLELYLQTLIFCVKFSHILLVPSYPKPFGHMSSLVLIFLLNTISGIDIFTVSYMHIT